MVVEEQIRTIDGRDVQRLLVDGLSLSAVIGHIHKQNGCVAAVSASGGFLQELGSRSMKVVHLNTLLHAHSGSSIAVDQSPHATYNLHPRLSILFAGPSSYIDKMMCSNPVLRNLSSCFLYLHDEGQHHIGRVLATAIPASVRDGYQQALALVLSSQDGWDLILDRGAINALTRFEREVGTILETVGADMMPWVAKLLNHAIRIAGILHVMHHPTAPTQAAISKDTLQNGIVVANFFFEHALRLYGLHAESQLDADVHYVLEKLNEMSVSEITVRALNEKTKASLGGVSRLKRALAELEQQGILHVNKKLTGTRPSEIVQMIR